MEKRGRNAVLGKRGGLGSGQGEEHWEEPHVLNDPGRAGRFQNVYINRHLN